MKILTIKDIYKDVKNEESNYYGFHAYTSKVADKLKQHDSDCYDIVKLDDAFIEIEVLDRDKFLELLKGIIKNTPNQDEKGTDNVISTISDLFRFIESSLVEKKIVLRERSLLVDNFLLESRWCAVHRKDSTGIFFTIYDKDKLLLDLQSLIDINNTPTDPINPTHYNGTQTLDRMIAVFGVDAVISFCEINAFKYRMRAGKKDGNPIEQDIEKALWYEGKANELKRKDNE